VVAVNKQERTYRALRDRIHDGTYQSLDRLNIDALARELDVSPIPVREALRRLEAEGWVQFRPNAGAIVAPVDATWWEQAMVSLAILEGAATAAARPHLREADLTRIDEISGELAKIAAEHDPLRFSDLNRELHDVIVSRCPNDYLLELREQTYRRLDRVRRTMFVYLPERAEAAVAEHARLIGLLRSGEPDEVERYARWHKLQTVEAYRAIHTPPSEGNSA
jgi:DNA-binding GntR family transcriptional regulator